MPQYRIRWHRNTDQVITLDNDRTISRLQFNKMVDGSLDRAIDASRSIREQLESPSLSAITTPLVFDELMEPIACDLCARHGFRMSVLKRTPLLTRDIDVSLNVERFDGPSGIRAGLSR